MQRCTFLVSLTLLLLSGAQSQDTTEQPTPPTTPWNGDPALCPPGTFTTTVPQKPQPKFPTKAEFTIERIERRKLLNISLPATISYQQHIFDYDANAAVIVKNENGLITAEYYDYKVLRKSTFYAGTFCTVTDIEKNNDMNGGSAVQLPDGTWHIRPLNEYLLFSNMNPTRPMITPLYLGQDNQRGIQVDRWRACYLDPVNYRTVRRIWAFAAPTMSTPFGPVQDNAVPVHAVISASVTFPNATEEVEFDEIYNIESYKPGIVENNDALSYPKGVFCQIPNNTNLVSLKDLGVVWPDRFSVRVEASSSRSPQSQRFHLRYSLGRDGTSRRIHYDYSPPGSEDFRSVIHDYGDRLTYTIDRRIGSCDITRLVDIPPVSPIRDPIDFFVKYESSFIFAPPENAWAFNGFRTCRGNTIQCLVAVTSIDNFPPIVESDTGLPTGETWAATNIEYTWSARSPTAPPGPGGAKLFDYPVSLYMKMFRFSDPLNPSILNVRSEDVEYEFYEMAKDLGPNDFDVSICYRSNSYEYLHVYFSLTVDRTGVFDTALLNRRNFERQIIRNVADNSQVDYHRISEVVAEHERSSNTVNVFFTMLGQKRIPETDSFDTTQPSAADALTNLRTNINGGKLQFSLTLADNSTANFRAETSSLKSSSTYMSTHSVTQVISSTTYSSGSQALAIILGLIIGLLVGVIGAVIIRKFTNQPLPNLSNVTNPLPSISFSSKKATPAASSNA